MKPSGGSGLQPGHAYQQLGQAPAEGRRPQWLKGEGLQHGCMPNVMLRMYVSLDAELCRVGLVIGLSCIHGS